MSNQSMDEIIHAIRRKLREYDQEISKLELYISSGETSRIIFAHQRIGFLNFCIDMLVDLADKLKKSSAAKSRSYYAEAEDANSLLKLWMCHGELELLYRDSSGHVSKDIFYAN